MGWFEAELAPLFLWEKREWIGLRSLVLSDFRMAIFSGLFTGFASRVPSSRSLSVLVVFCVCSIDGCGREDSVSVIRLVVDLKVEKMEPCRTFGR